MSDNQSLPEEFQAIKEAENWDVALQAANQLMEDNPLLVAAHRTSLDVNNDGRVSAGEIVESMGHQKPEEKQQTANCGCSRS